jgi:AcrR family transcriptional regulator
LGIIERKERQRKGLRQEILSAALDVFANEGYHQLSMRRLAEKIEYSPTTIYLHFKDKAELFECVCEQTFAQLSEIFSQVVRAATDPLDAFVESCRAYIDFGLRHPDQYTVAFLLDSGQRLTPLAPEEVLQRFPKAMEAFYQLRSGVTDCMATGKFVEGDPDLVSQVVWAALHGITALLIVKPSFPWCDRGTLIDLMIQTMIRSMRPNSAQALTAPASHA